MYRRIINEFRRLAGAVTRGTAVLGLAGLVALGTVTLSDAEAKRMGGGQSIGRQSQTTSPSGQAQRSQQAQPTQQAAQPPAATGNRWMGPLAGLAAGLGIAALLSSFGLGEELAQMLANALLIGLVIFAGAMLFRFFVNRRRQQFAYGHSGVNRQPTNGSQLLNQIWRASEASSWGWSRSAMGSTGVADKAVVQGPLLGADQATFVTSAKTMFIRLQHAWDQNEQGDLFELTTPEMFAQIKRDLESRSPKASHTEVTQLDAEVVRTESNTNETLVSVRFYGQMREDDAEIAQPFEEVWNVVRDARGGQGWRLAGIQQIDRQKE